MWESLSPEDRAGYASPLSPLKLVIMSATLRVADFQGPELFDHPPPVIKVTKREGGSFVEWLWC